MTEKLLFWGKENFGQNSKLDSFLKILRAQGFLAGSEDVGIHPGSILNINPKIIYPRQAIQQRHEGVVVVLIHIATNGRCSRVDLLQSSGHAELDDQVLGAVQHWRFIPPRRGQMPVEATYKHTVIFGADERAFDDFEAHWHEIRVMPAP